MFLFSVFSFSQVTKTYFTCPMHPEIVSSKPGDCPKCGMTLRVRTAESFQNSGCIYGRDAVSFADAHYSGCKCRPKRKGFTGVQQGRYSAFKKASRKFYGQF